MDLDGNGGKTFLRVLLHLAMHDYPPLVSGALRLLFRNFSQRQEVLQAFKQVQLLVSDRDVEHYKQIKDDLDGLRLLVEKSELWVYKTRTVEEKPSKSGAVTPTPGGGAGTALAGEGSAGGVSSHGRGVSPKRRESEVVVAPGETSRGESVEPQIQQPTKLLPTQTAAAANPTGVPTVVVNGGRPIKPGSSGTSTGDSGKMSLPIAVAAVARQRSVESMKGLIRGPSLPDLDYGPPSDHVENYKTIQQILTRMNKLCINASDRKPRKHEQVWPL